MPRALLALFLLAASVATAETVRYPIARDESGAIRIAHLVSVVLSEMDSGVRIPDDAIGTRLPIPRDPSALAVVVGLSGVLHRYGVAFELSATALTVVIDRDKVHASTVALERWARGLGGVDTPYALEHHPRSRPGPPVVLVHGLDSRPERMTGTADALARAGYDVWFYRYPNDGSLDETARDLGRRLAGLHRRTGRAVNVVTTSMGGVITQIAVELEPYQRGTVDRFIACSPPFQGSPMARYHALLELPETVSDLFTDGLIGFFPFDGLGAAGFDLLPGSRLYQRLASAERRPGVRYSILAGRRSIVPLEVVDRLRTAVFAALPEAGPLAAVGYQMLLELTDAVALVSGGLGDGAVPLHSQTLPGVADRVVGDATHLDCYDGDGRDRPIPWLAETLERLPRVR